jgi:hypothetical protein
MISIFDLFETFDIAKARKIFFQKQAEKLKGEKQIPGSVSEKLHKQAIENTEREASGRYPK